MSIKLSFLRPQPSSSSPSPSPSTSTSPRHHLSSTITMPPPIGTTVFRPKTISVSSPAAATSGPSTTKRAPTKKRGAGAAFIDLTVEPSAEATITIPYLTLWRHRVQLALPKKDASNITDQLAPALQSASGGTLPVTITCFPDAGWPAWGHTFRVQGADGAHLLAADVSIEQGIRDLSEILSRFQRGSKVQRSFAISWSLLLGAIPIANQTHITFELEVKRRDSCIIDWKAEKWLSLFLSVTVSNSAAPPSLADVRAAINASSTTKGDIKAKDFYHCVYVPPAATVVPEAIQVSELTTTMFPFQMRTVNWMMEREGVTVESGCIEPLPITPSVRNLCFEETVDLNGTPMWVSIPLGITTTDRAGIDRLAAESGIKGGILAEEMGLGKTVELISLLALHKRHIPSGEETVWDSFSGTKIRTSASTLIICPPSIMQQWINELELHAPGLRVLKYDGTRDLTQLVYQKKNGVKARVSNGRYRDLTTELQSIPNSDLIEYLLEYDIVLSSYNVLANEIHYAEKPPDRSLRQPKRFERRSCPLVEIQWWRVCLDEAQMIESGVSNAAQVARLIPRVNAWAVTGTPVQKSIEDLYGLLVFLRQGPWCGNKITWEKLCFKKEWFGGVFHQLALRHTKDIVHEEIHLPRQHRTAISLGFSQVEEENYQALFQRACREIEVDLDGSPLQGDWNPENEDTRSKMREWLGRLRQTCVHPRVGALNRRALGANTDGLRTANEVLEAMMTQNTNLVKQDQRTMFVLIAARAQLIAEGWGSPHGAVTLLMEFLDPLEIAVGECRTELEVESLRLESEKEARKEREREAEELMDIADTTEDENTNQHESNEEGLQESDDEYDESFEGDGGPAHDLNKLKNRLRDIIEVQHTFHFYLGQAHYNLKDCIPEDDEERHEERMGYEKLEDKHYDIAKALRKELMSEPENQVNKFISVIAKRTENQDFVDIPEINIKEQRGGIESTTLMDDILALAEKLNSQADLLDKWREELIQLLQLPLTDQEDTKDLEGDEFQESTEQQDTGFLYVAFLRAVIADRRQALTGITISHYNNDIESAEARLESKDEKHQELFYSLKDQRDEVKPLNIEIEVGSDAVPFSIRGLLAKLRRLANPLHDSSATVTARAKAEAGLVNQAVKVIAPLFSKQEETLKALEKEIDFLNKVFNTRLEFYRQLQIVSDTVISFDEAKALKANHVRNLTLLHDKYKKEVNDLSNSVAKAKSKGRFLQHLAENQGDNQRQCIICQDDVKIGVLTICGHQFCKECMDAWYKHHPSCPMCKRSLKKVDLHPVTYMMQDIVVEKENRTLLEATNQDETSNETGDKGIEIYTGIESDTFRQIKKIPLRENFGSKIDMIIRHLLWIRRTGGGKNVLFSQWKEVLDVLSRAMEANGIGYSSLESKLGLNKFKTDDKTEVFLLHAKSQSAGLTLVTASNVFLVEPLVNIGIEVQAIARVHRIGQKRETNVFLYVIGNTVEEGVWRLSTKRRVEMLEEKGSPQKKRRKLQDQEQPDRKGKRRARDVEIETRRLEEDLEVQLEITNSLQLQEGTVGSMVEKGQNGGEIVNSDHLWGCLFGVQRKDKTVEIEGVRREQVIAAREEGRGNVVDDSGVFDGAGNRPAILNLQGSDRIGNHVEGSSMAGGKS
ncbi:hypothetical protein EYR41_004936 [Orbilia oligospora]|uniref:Uncharacterized protein n=1 Tax=Orbilia oligospora TaxID=2813651 RepID=A0A7C8PVV0_ORBOL|nr:hypothetical protein TWF751_009354 [Orbilia oligospora]TGJ68854.1 hypothetical protein EYR41_004936 [Orbilia oligospora]